MHHKFLRWCSPRRDSISIHLCQRTRVDPTSDDVSLRWIVVYRSVCVPYLFSYNALTALDLYWIIISSTEPCLSPSTIDMEPASKDEPPPKRQRSAAQQAAFANAKRKRNKNRKKIELSHVILAGKIRSLPHMTLPVSVHFLALQHQIHRQLNRQWCRQLSHSHKRPRPRNMLQVIKSRIKESISWKENWSSQQSQLQY